MKSSVKECSAGKPKEMPPVPDLKMWGYHHPGDSQSYGHKLHTKHGEYHIMPATSGGRHVGYHLQFAHTGESKPEKGEGMWEDLGLHTHPGKAVAAARAHHKERDKESGGSKKSKMLSKLKKSKKNESVVESVDKQLRRNRLAKLISNARRLKRSAVDRARNGDYIRKNPYAGLTPDEVRGGKLAATYLRKRFSTRSKLVKYHFKRRDRADLSFRGRPAYGIKNNGKLVTPAKSDRKKIGKN